MNIKDVPCKRHENSLFKSLKFPANVTKVPQCHKCSLVSSQKFPSDVLKVPYGRHKSSLSRKSALFPSPKFPIFDTKVPFLLALSLSLCFLFYFCFKLLYERLSFSPLNCNKDKGRKLPVRLRRKLYVGYICNSFSKSCLLLLDMICA